MAGRCIGVARYGDLTLGCGTHHARCCPHVLHGYHIVQNNVHVNNRPGAAHLESLTIHDCPHCMYGRVAQGNPTVLLPGVCKPIHSLHMMIDEGCGWGMTITASPNVLTKNTQVMYPCPPPIPVEPCEPTSYVIFREYGIPGGGLGDNDLNIPGFTTEYDLDARLSMDNATIDDTIILIWGGNRYGWNTLSQRPIPIYDIGPESSPLPDPFSRNVTINGLPFYDNDGNPMPTIPAGTYVELKLYNRSGDSPINVGLVPGATVSLECP